MACFHRAVVCCMTVALLSFMPLHLAKAINVTLDYAYDSSNFFGSGNPDGAVAGAQARAALEDAADFFSDILTDTFSRIETPDPFVGQYSTLTWTWSLTFNNPGGSGIITLTDPTILEDEYRIYVGAERSLRFDPCLSRVLTGTR